MKKVVALLINDVHLNKDNGSLVKDIFKQVVGICRKNSIEHIIIGGDVFTNRSGQPLDCLTNWDEILGFISKKKLQIHLIPGNHDKTDKDDKRSYLTIYRRSCLNLYSVATVVDILGLRFFFIPYFGDEKWLEEFERVKEEITKNSILITHMGFDGVVNNDGSRVSSFIKPSMFQEFSKVFIGHYHNASKLAKNVIYTGSAYQNDFGEKIEDKGCTLIYDDGSYKLLPLKFPKYIKEVIDVNDAERTRELTERYENDDYNHIRFIFKGKKVDANKINETYFAERGIDVKFESDEENKSIECSEDETFFSYDIKTLMKDFISFCAENSIKGKHLKYGMNLIKEL